jgi:hypothetical protein
LKYLTELTNSRLVDPVIVEAFSRTASLAGSATHRAVAVCRNDGDDMRYAEENVLTASVAANELGRVY